MPRCDVTVVIPNFNRSSYLARALRSVASQSWTPSEVLVIDDGSESHHLDAIRKVVATFGDALPIELLTNETNRGANACRNTGLARAKSRYVAFLDSDDLWLPQKLETQMRLIATARQTDTRPVLSYTGRYRVSRSGEILARQFSGKVLTADSIRRSNFIGTLSSVVVETWVARHIHGFTNELPASQDWEFFIRLADYVQLVGVPQHLCVYVEHADERITLNHRKRLAAHFQLYRTYIAGLPEREKQEFYRNVAEDLQQLGKPRLAETLYAKALAAGSTDNARLRAIGACVLRRIVRGRLPQSIKAARYSAYRKAMSRASKIPAVRDQIARDAATIRALLA